MSYDAVWYVTKYGVASKSIQKMVGTAPHEDGMVQLKGRPVFDLYKVGRDVHATEAEARAHLAKQVKKKIESMRKQIKALEAAEFPVVDG